MTRAPAKRLPLPVRRSMNLTEDAYASLRQLSETYGLGNNYVLVVLLENLGKISDPDALDQAFKSFVADYGPTQTAARGTQERSG